jgi:hypothetical protein
MLSATYHAVVGIHCKYCEGRRQCMRLPNGQAYKIRLQIRPLFLNETNVLLYTGHKFRRRLARNHKNEKKVTTLAKVDVAQEQ